MKEEKPQGESIPKDGKVVTEKDNKKLMTKEERQTGTVKLDIYVKYIKAGGGYFIASCVFFMYIISTGTQVASSVWVSVWTADSSYQRHTE